MEESVALDMIKNGSPIEKMITTLKGNFTEASFIKLMESSPERGKVYLLSNPNLPQSIVDKTFETGSLANKMRIISRLSDEDAFSVLDEISGNDAYFISTISKVGKHPASSDALKNEIWNRCKDDPVLKIIASVEGLSPSPSIKEELSVSFAKTQDELSTLSSSEDFLSFYENCEDKGVEFLAKLISIMMPTTPSDVLSDIALSDNIVLSTTVMLVKAKEIPDDIVFDFLSKVEDPLLQAVLALNPNISESVRETIIKDMEIPEDIAILGGLLGEHLDKENEILNKSSFTP